MLQLLSISLFFNALCSVSISLMQKNFSFKLISFVTLTSDFISFLLGIIFAFLGYGVWSLVYVALSRSILKALGYFYFAPIKFGSKFYFKEYKELFSFGSGIILIKIGNFIGANGINLILGKILAPEIFGVFDRANKIKGIPIRLLSSVWNKVMFPVMSEIQDEKERVFKLYNFGIGISNVLLMPLTTLLIFFADEIVFILLGSKWIEAVLPLQILFLIIPFAASSIVADTLLTSLGLVYLNAKRKYIYVSFLIISVSIGAFYYGIIGASIACTVSYIINYLLMIQLVKGVLNKTFSEIFINPLFEAIYLSIFLALIVFVFKLSFNLFSEINLPLSFLFLILLSSFLCFLFLKRPKLFGNNLNFLIKIIRNQKTDV